MLSGIHNKKQRVDIFNREVSRFENAHKAFKKGLSEGNASYRETNTASTIFYRRSDFTDIWGANRAGIRHNNLRYRLRKKRGIQIHLRDNWKIVIHFIKEKLRISEERI